MLQIPRIALFRADRASESQIAELFQKHEYSIRVVESIEMVTHLTLDEGSNFDAIVMPLQLSGDAGAASLCMQLRTDELLASVPILALSNNRDATLLQAVYRAGADVVFTAPFQADLLFLQIGALARLKRAFDEKINRRFQESGLFHPVVKAFDSVRDALLLFDANFRLIFSNASGAIMLGMDDETTKQEILRLAQQFVPYIKEHDSAAKSQARGSLPLSSTFEASVNRVTGQSFHSMLTFTTISRDQNELVGYSMAMKDLSEIHHLANTLIQSQRTRALCLVTTASCVKLLEAMHQKTILSPLQYIEDFSLQGAAQCALNATVTSLLEALDLVINPNLNIRVKIDQDLVIAMRPSDFFQLIGHLLLHAVEHAGMKGEASIHSTTYLPGHGVTITISAESRKVTPFSADDLMSSLIHGDFARLKTFEDIAEKLRFGLVTAQKIAENYRTTVEYQQPSSAVLRMRVKLPALAPGSAAEQSNA